MLNISIIGFGRTGSHLYYALKRSGKVKIRSVVKHKNSIIDAAQLSASDVIFICVNDSNIVNAAEKILNSGINLKGKIVLHTSGAKNSDELILLKKAGAMTGSFHPVQTFVERAKKYSGTFKNIYIAIEGDPKSSAAASAIARLVNSKPMKLTKEQKVFHHICCVFSSNYLVTLMSKTGLSFGKIRDGKILKNGFNNTNFFDIYKPLVEQTLANISKIGPISALTGPIERNDRDTLELHLRTIQKRAPELMSVYVIMGIETVKTALDKKSLNKSEALNLIKLLNKY